MKDLNFFSLIKFGSEQAVYDLYKNGTIYLNPLEYFRKFEDKGLRGDNYEGILEVRNLPAGKFNVIKEGKPWLKDLDYRSIHLRKSIEKVIGNVYCLYSIRPKHLENKGVFKLDIRVQRFGSHFLMIFNEGIQEFLDKLFDKLQTFNLYYEYGFVEYYNKFSLNADVNIFMKPEEFAYQNEFRIYVQHLINEPLIIKIGSLKDIAMVHETKIIPDLEIQIE